MAHNDIGPGAGTAKESKVGQATSEKQIWVSRAGPKGRCGSACRRSVCRGGWGPRAVHPGPPCLVLLTSQRGALTGRDGSPRRSGGPKISLCELVLGLICTARLADGWDRLAQPRMQRDAHLHGGIKRDPAWGDQSLVVWVPAFSACFSLKSREGALRPPALHPPGVCAGRGRPSHSPCHFTSGK